MAPGRRTTDRFRRSTAHSTATWAYARSTNTMPVLRAGLLEAAAQPHDFVMAWVAVPDITVHRSEQRYEPIDRHHVRYVGRDHSFKGVLELGRRRPGRSLPRAG